MSNKKAETDNMNKRRPATSKEVEQTTDLVDEVISSLREDAKLIKKKRTLPLNEVGYDAFEIHCKTIGTTPSKAIDKFIASFNRRMVTK